MNATREKGGAAVSQSTPWDRFDLLERDAELAAIERLVSEAPAAGRLLAIEGPAGIGKTSLIAEAKARAQRAEMEVASARGSEIEQAFSYGVVRQLFEPLLSRASTEQREELLYGAAGLSTPLFEPAQLASEASTEGSLTLLHGLYWLAVTMAARRPLLLAVDDLHWCDASSLRWLAYLLPRMEGLGVAVVVGARSGEPGADPAVVAQILSDPLATVIRPAPLSAGAVSELVRRTLSSDADDSFGAACHEETGGNPQLLRELVQVIAAERVAPSEANIARARELGGRAGLRPVVARLARLRPEATRLAQAVAILGDDADARQTAAVADLDGRSASEAASDLVRVDILRPEPPLGFVHPLVRAAVYSMLTAVEREQGHARAARLLAESGAEPERVAAHLLRTSPAGDAAVVRTLRAAAQGALARAAPESAIAYLLRALDEPPPQEERAGVLLDLGTAETLVSGRAAVEHLREAYELIGDPVRRAEAAVLLGRHLFLRHRPDESAEVLQAALEDLGSADAELSRRLQAPLIHTAMMEPRLYGLALELIARVRDRPSDASAGEKMLLGLLAYHDARANMPADVAVDLARRALAGGILQRAAKGGGPFIMSSIVLAMADLDEALEVYDDALAEAHLTGSVFAFAAVKVFRSQAFLYRGDLHEAEREGREALEASDAWGLDLAAGYLTGYLAAALVEQGKLDAAEAVLARGGFEDDPDTAHAHWFLDARVRLWLARGEFRRGLEETLAAGRSFEAVGGRNPAFMPWRSQAALALLQLGDRDEARRLATEEVELARVWGARRALGTALCAAGLVEGGEHGLALLREAVQVLDDSPAKLAKAKALTELGAALRRTRRRAEAREELRRALELATMCGATPLVKRAETELLATGARPRRVALSGIDSLTPSERRVAGMAAEGLTNREIAQALYVTPKTVEVHLSSVYRKLGISARTQLLEALGEPAPGR